MIRPPRHIPTEMFTIELVYFALVMVLCLVIYFKTKEIYDLTQRKGIAYFRNTFLFFALAYALRFVLLVVALSLDKPFVFRNPAIGLLSLLLFSYFSSMAILSLAFSSFWKNVKQHSYLYDVLLHVLAIFISVVAVLSKSYLYLVILQACLLLFAFVMTYLNSKSSKKISFFNQLHVTYFLLFIFWILNSAVFIPRLVKLPFKLPLYVISTALFIFIFVKVIKRLSLDGKKA